MGKNYEDLNELFCEEFCKEVDKFEKTRDRKYLCGIKELVEVINGLQEMEMDAAIRSIAEDYGYDSSTGRFHDKHVGGMMEFMEMFNAAKGRSMGTRRRRDSRGRYMAMGIKPTVYYPPEPDEYPWEYPYYMMNDGRREYSGERKRDRDDDDMMNTGRNGNRGNGRGGRVNGGDDDMYMLRQENGRPIMTPYNMAHDVPKKLTDQECEEWMERIVNFDGSEGGKWTKAQVEAEAKRAGIDISKYGACLMTALTDAMYADYGEIGKMYNCDKPSFYIRLAEAFLDDEDFQGKDGAEKASIYFHKIVEHE